MKNRGVSSTIDIVMYSMIIIIAMAFLQVYSVTHQSTDIKELKAKAEEKYAANTLLTLSYLTNKDADYMTVQAQAVENTPDEDLQPIVGAADSIRNNSRALNEKLENWSKNVTAAHDEIKAVIGEAMENVSAVKEAIDAQQEGLGVELEKAKDNCDDYVGNINTFSELIGGETLSGDPCTGIEDTESYISDTTKGIDESLIKVNDTLYKIKDSIDTDLDLVQGYLQEARCILKEVDIKTDRFVTYAQLGVRENTTLIDLWPAKANLGTKTVTETIGEALYTEDRLAKSGELQAAGAFGARIALQESGYELSDSKNRIAQGLILAIEREDYRNLAKKAVKSSLTKQLSDQGYNYCFTAKTCCSMIQEGNCVVPYTSVKAKTNIKTNENETVEMTISIWKK
jgi:hypothetical protein